MDTGFAEFDVTLRDGRAVHLRTLRESDEAELVQAFDRMSPDARYMRFMRAVREPNLERVRTTLASFPGSGIGLVATVPAADGIDIVGSTIFVVGSNEASCEFAINVASDFGGVGLATILLTALIGAAKARGLTEMEGFVLAANQPMLRLARRLGFSVAADPDDRSVRVCRLQLADAPDSSSAT
jgi:RimJ/RimL family protein N-acetyltransferase